MMLLQPQRPAPESSGVTATKFGRKKSSVVSFTSSNHDGYDAEDYRDTSIYHGQSRSSDEQQRGYFDTQSSSHSNQLHHASVTDDADYTKFASQSGRRGSFSQKQSVSHDSKPIKNGTASTKASGGMGTLRGLGRRLFNRSSSNLKAAPLLASRSQSASSCSTNAQSPPLTPTTPPQIQPAWLPNGQKDFFSNFSGLPSNVQKTESHSRDLLTRSESFSGISPKTRQGAFCDNHSSHDDSGNHTFDANSSQGHGSVSTFSHHSSASAFPSFPSAAAAHPSFSSGMTRREIPAVIEEEGDSEFLRAVLNFGEGTDGSPQTPSFRGGRAAPLPTSSSLLGQIANIASSPSSFASPSPYPPPRRTTDGRVILTQQAARDFASEKPTPAYVVVNRKYRKGLFGNDSESEDEYGNDEKDNDADVLSPSTHNTAAAENQGAVASPSQSDEAARYPSSFSKARTHSPSNEDNAAAPRPSGLDSAAKKALYNCTLLKVHMHLAATLAGDAEAQSQIPVIAAGEQLYDTDDIRFPRSINAKMKLQQHSSTYAFSRNLRVALARTLVLRKLRRDKLNIEQEVEISWFQRRYGSASIAPGQVAKALRQRQMVSPEALAKPPIAAPQDSAMASAEGSAASRRLSGIAGLEPGQKSEKNGIITWAQRPSFLARKVELFAAEEVAPGEVLVTGAAKLGEHGRAGSMKLAVSFSPRIRVLAGLPSVEEEKRMRYPIVTKKFRPRDMHSKRASRLGSASEGTVWEGPDRRASSRPERESQFASPSSKQKKLPPWMAPRNPHLLSPQSKAQLRQARAASEGLTAFSTLHQNSSTASIPEVRETNEQDGNSSDEEVPLAQLQTFRAQRIAEKERIQKLENKSALLRQKNMEREKEKVERIVREEEVRRIEAQRAHEERKAAVEARRLEKNRRILQEARERRGFTRRSVLLNEPNYGAGNPLSGHHRPKQGRSPSSPYLALAPISPTSTVGQHGATQVKLQGNLNANRSTTTLYVQQEAQRRSRTSVVAPPEPVTSPMTSPRLRSSATITSPIVDLQRNNSMASLAAQQSLPHRQTMVQLATMPQITQRRTSLLPPPPDAVHDTTSMQNLAATSPHMLSAGPTAFLSPADPRHSMSMTNLHAQAFYAQQAQIGLQRPMLAQTVNVSSRSRPVMPPLVSLFGDVVPSSAMQRRS